MGKPELPSRPLGNTGIRVSEICLGTMQFRWTCTEAMSYRVLDSFFRAGGNFIDTADIYTYWVKGLKGGEAETIIGNWLKKRRNRRQVVLASKCMVRMWPGTTGEGLSRVHMVQACEDSLRRLQTDFIDLYQAHWPDPGTPIEETLAAYAGLIRAGKIRYAGCSNFSGGLLGEALALSRHAGLPQLVSIQPKYNLLLRDFEQDHVALVKKYGVAVIPYSPLMAGLLTGKYRKGRPLPASDRASGLKSLLTDKTFKVIETLDRLGKKRGKTVAQMALGWLLSHDWITAPIVGANSPEQLADNLGAAALKLTPEERSELDKVSG